MSDLKFKVIETWDEAKVLPSVMAIAVKYEAVPPPEEGELAAGMPQPTPQVDEE